MVGGGKLAAGDLFNQGSTGAVGGGHWGAVLGTEGHTGGGAVIV